MREPLICHAGKRFVVLPDRARNEDYPEDYGPTPGRIPPVDHAATPPFGRTRLDGVE